MEEKTARQEHQEKVNAVQATLNELLRLSGYHAITLGGKLVGKDSHKSMVTIEVTYSQTADENSVKVTRAKPAGVWIIEYNNVTNAVVDTTEFNGEIRRLGKIHFTRPELSTIEGAENLLTLIRDVQEWKPAK